MLLEDEIQNQARHQETLPSPPVITVDGVSKKFCRDLKRSLFYGIQDIAADLIGGRQHSDRLRPREFWALQSINFQLHRGQALGLVGSNGAGKSTLLRIISGLIKPDTGSVRIRGRIAPLIALGAGFNPILTGRENIFANMSILGLTTQEIKERFEDVVAFAEIESAIDAPVQTYSSGMAARLGFACAVYTEPDILLIDEVLAVGDARFKAKCYRRLYELRQRGVAFILVNHNSQAILNICDTAMYLSGGALITQGEVNAVVDRYEADLFLAGTQRSENRLSFPAKPSQQSTGIDIRALFFRDDRGEPTQTLLTGEPLSFCVTCEAHDTYDGVTLNFRVVKVGGEERAGNMLSIRGENDDAFFKLSPGLSELQIRFPYLGLGHGTYAAQIRLRREGIYTFDIVESFRFTVATECDMKKCQFYQPRTWHLTSDTHVEP
ncbi:polysaccharide ABC transporter ATP-binding protein [Oscillatoria sp. CS-180]|uniref:ABC transporter ATP-binding protein n=1 Tax=Oscillatoria sp. CS-180 TaxID=3021720 RepID=UPI00232F5074|nr:polysaccharide ABC transporter ATP-binding protein [Oscillatoria sp. CS-180]MDB9527131.1 polysaccharide ABC transporter ATP-binding protein [Oscillatoria sp. CS-180]